MEQHCDTVSGVSAAQGQYWTDPDGYQNNVQIAQKVKDKLSNTSIRLGFQLASTDLTDLTDVESLTVTFGGKAVYKGAPKGAAWETISTDVIGDSSNGSARLVFSMAEASWMVRAQRWRHADGHDG